MNRQIIYAGLVFVLLTAAWYGWSNNPEFIRLIDTEASERLEKRLRTQETAKHEAEIERAMQSRVAKRAKKEEAARAKLQFKAILACYKTVRSRAKYPTKVKFKPDFLGMPTVVSIGDRPDLIGVRGGVDMMNAFGAMIPHRYACNVKGGTVLHVVVAPG